MQGEVGSAARPTGGAGVLNLAEVGGVVLGVCYLAEMGGVIRGFFTLPKWAGSLGVFYLAEVGGVVFFEQYHSAD